MTGRQFLRLLLFLRAMWLFATRSSWVPAPAWEDEDRLALHQFLRTAAGAKLRMLLTAQIAAANERAALEGTPKAAGWACGYKAFWAQWQFLSAVPPTQEDNYEDDQSGLGNLAHLNP